MNEKEAKEIIKESERKAIDDACNALRGHVRLTEECIAQLVASLCNVRVRDMLMDKGRSPFSLARGLYWYTIKQVFNVTNDYISKASTKHTHFKISCVRLAISNMSMLIQKDSIWQKRWYIIKRVIDEIYKVDEL